MKRRRLARTRGCCARIQIRPARSSRRQLELEALEDRLLLADAGVGPVGDVLIPPPVIQPNPLLLVTTDYLLHEQHGGMWADAEKSPTNYDDDSLCWAATAANVLAWTGWGEVGGMTTADEMFAYFQTYWTDDGGYAQYAWKWWLDGTNAGASDSSCAQLDVSGGGDWFPWEDIGDYHHATYTEADAMSGIDTYLHAGYGVGLELQLPGGGGHAVTCWGYAYTTGDPTDYVGVWITDSDDDDYSTNPPDRLRCYEVEYDVTAQRWYLPDYGMLIGTDRYYINEVHALEPVPPADLVDSDDVCSWFWKTAVQAGEAWTCSFDIANEGVAHTGPFTVDFYASTDATISAGDYLLGSVQVNGVGRFGWATARLELAQFPAHVPTGDYYVGILIDTTNAVAEANEYNNTAVDLGSGKLSVTSKPDLCMADYHWSSPQTVMVTDPWECMFYIDNQSADWSDAFDVKFYASIDATITATDYYLGTVTVCGMNPNTWAPANLVLSSFPGHMPPGDYYVGVVIDPANAVAEFNEANNAGADMDDYPLTVVYPRLALPAPDLVGWRLEGPWFGQWGGVIQAVCQVNNTGEASASAFDVAYYLTDASGAKLMRLLPNGEDVYRHAGLDAGELGAAFTVSLYVPRYNPWREDGSAEFHIAMEIDPLNEVSEAYEANNFRQWDDPDLAGGDHDPVRLGSRPSLPNRGPNVERPLVLPDTFGQGEPLDQESFLALIDLLTERGVEAVALDAPLRASIAQLVDAAEADAPEPDVAPLANADADVLAGPTDALFASEADLSSLL